MDPVVLSCLKVDRSNPENGRRIINDYYKTENRKIAQFQSQRVITALPTGLRSKSNFFVINKLVALHCWRRRWRVETNPRPILGLGPIVIIASSPRLLPRKKRRMTARKAAITRHLGLISPALSPGKNHHGASGQSSACMATSSSEKAGNNNADRQKNGRTAYK